jgi:hypothetical protein
MEHNFAQPRGYVPSPSIPMAVCHTGISASCTNVRGIFISVISYLLSPHSTPLCQPRSWHWIM